MPSVASCNDMMECPFKMDSRSPYHENSLSKNDDHVNTELPLPDPIDQQSVSRKAGACLDSHTVDSDSLSD
jgi:hypothetical protein